MPRNSTIAIALPMADNRGETTRSAIHGAPIPDDLVTGIVDTIVLPILTAAT